jgi:hypothetical protein
MHLLPTHPPTLAQGFDPVWNANHTHLTCVISPEDTSLPWPYILGIALGSLVALMLALALVLMQVRK